MNDNNQQQTGDEKSKSQNALALAPILREEVCRVETLGVGAKLLYCRLTDLIFMWTLSKETGVVKIGRPALAEMLGCSESTIERYQKELEDDGRIWTYIIYEARSKITAWCIRKIANPQLEFSDRPSRSFGPARLKRTASPRGADGKFVRGEPSRQICFDGKIRENEAEEPELTVLIPQNHGDCLGNSAETVSAETTVLNRRNGHDHNGNSTEIKSANLTVLSPQNGAGHNGEHAEPVSARVPSKENIHSLKSQNKGYGGDTPPPEKQFQAWLKSLEGAFPSQLRQLEKTFTLKLAEAQSKEAKAEWKRRLAIVQERLQGGPVEDQLAKPARVEPKPTMTFQEQQSAWKKAKADLLKQKAAGRTAART